jgi:hypothetical protein
MIKMFIHLIIYKCIYIYTYIYSYTYIYIHIYIYIYIHVHTCLSNLFVFIYIYMCINIDTGGTSLIRLLVYFRGTLLLMDWLRVFKDTTWPEYSDKKGG